MKPEEFDEAFDKWLKERFKPFRDKQRPSDYGKDLAPDSEKTAYTPGVRLQPQPLGRDHRRPHRQPLGGRGGPHPALRARTARCCENLTKGYTEQVREHHLRTTTSWPGAPSASTPRATPSPSSRARARGAACTWSPCSPATIVQAHPHRRWTRPSRPACCPTAAARSSPPSRRASPTSTLRRHRDGRDQEPHPGRVPRQQPAGLARRQAGGLHPAHQRPRQDLRLPAGRPRAEDPAHLRQPTTTPRPSSPPTAARIYYSSTEDDEIYNLRSLDLKTGVIRQYTDALGGNMTPAVLPGKGTERVAFISYFKGEYRLQTLEIGGAPEGGRAGGRVASEEVVDFQPDVVRTRWWRRTSGGSGTFEKLFLEGRPPLNVGVTSQRRLLRGQPGRALRRAGRPQLHLHRPLRCASSAATRAPTSTSSRRLHWGFSALRQHPVLLRRALRPAAGLLAGEGPSPPSATRRADGVAQYPLDKFRRLEPRPACIRVREGFENPFAEQAAREQAAAARGRPSSSTTARIAPVSVSLVGETTRFREFGPLAGAHLFASGVQLRARPRRHCSRAPRVEVDARKYFRIGQGTVFAMRVPRASSPAARAPTSSTSAATWSCAGFPYLSLVGNEGFFANVEFRFPLIDVMKTPLGILGPVRGTLFAGVGRRADSRASHYEFATREPGMSYVQRPGLRRAGLRLPPGGRPRLLRHGAAVLLPRLPAALRLDQAHRPQGPLAGWRFDFWIGYDF